MELRVAVIAGDGIGPEIMAVATAMLDRVQAQSNAFRLVLEPIRAGAALYAETGVDIDAADLGRAYACDAILLGAIGLPSVRYPDGTEISPHLRMRKDLDLYAGIRPVKRFACVPPVLADARATNLDLVIVRESTEGLFAHRDKGTVEGDRVARETLEITRHTTERLCDRAFELARARKARGRPGKVTCVDKANVFRAFAFFRKVFDERAAAFPDIEAGHAYVDAMALDLVRKPWAYDVLVMENMFGDILSDLGAGLVGGMGFAPCAEIGDAHGLFQPAHGSAPDIAGSGKANPTAMVLSAAMMLDWLGHKHGSEAMVEAARAIEVAVERSFDEAAVRPVDAGGADGTVAIGRAWLELLG